MNILKNWISKLSAFRNRIKEHSYYSALRDSLLLVVLLLLGVLAALVIADPWSPTGVPVSSITIEGVDIPTGDSRPEELIRLARSRLQKKVLLKGPDFSHSTTWAALGATLDMSALGELLISLKLQGSPSAKYFEKYGNTKNLPFVSLPITLSSNSAVESLASLKDIIDREPADAVFNFRKEQVEEEKDGLLLDVYGTLFELDLALKENRDEIEMKVIKVPAAITKATLHEINVSEVVGYFETPYSQMKKDEDRTYNVTLGASRLDGHIIMPNEIFSFNDILGDRTEANGFRYAPVIAGGVLVEGMGGGTCQVASTLYAASFFAGLVIVERQTHSRPSSYIKLGLDATVSYPDLDLKIKNPFDFPVAVHFIIEKGILRAEIRGKKRNFTVTLLRRVLSQKPFPVRIIDEPNLLSGKEVITQNGIPGYTVRRYQIIEADKVGYRFQTIDKYPPTAQLVRRGTASSAATIDSSKAPKPDTHKPYHASTYLRMVQGPGGLWYEQTHE